MRTLLTVLSLSLFWSSCASPPSGRVPADPAGVEETRGLDWAARLEGPGPSRELRRLEVLCGTWEVVVEDLWSAPEPTRVASGEAEIKSILGGRFLAWQSELEFGGRRISAEGRLGFDESNDVLQLLWMSELSRGMRIAAGRGDARRGGLMLEISERDPESGLLLRGRTVLALADDDHFSLTQERLDAETAEWIAQQRTSYARRAASTPAQGASSQR